MALTLSLRFPTGRYAAAAWDDKDAAEWPPHPARLALAFVDVLHKAGNPPELRAALEWLCALKPPAVVVPTEERIDVQQLGGYFVPQNPTKAESTRHPRKSRSFPTIYLESEAPAIYFHWADAEPEPSTKDGIGRLAAALPRFGHSSSIVVAAASEQLPPVGPEWNRLVPCSGETPAGTVRLRVPYPGLLSAAEAAYDAAGRAEEMSRLLKQAGKGVKSGKMLQPPASPRGRHDPRHLWQAYEPPSAPRPGGTAWDQRVLLLTKAGGDRLGLASTWQISETLHRTLIDRWSRDPDRGIIPRWLSGHEPGTTATAPARANHLAVFPVADVGHPHASGHLMGLGLALPSPESAKEEPLGMRTDWRKALAALFPEGRALELTAADHSWTIRLQPTEALEDRRALQLERWVRPARVWQSITPVILDRHPRPHFRKDPEKWAESCRGIIRTACERIGLPRPEAVEVSPYAPIQGVPPAARFTPPARRPGRPPRFHVHVSLRFEQDVAGPLILGAGRFRGYGLLMPLLHPSSAPPPQS